MTQSRDRPTKRERERESEAGFRRSRFILHAARTDSTIYKRLTRKKAVFL